MERRYAPPTETCIVLVSPSIAYVSGLEGSSMSLQLLITGRCACLVSIRTGMLSLVVYHLCVAMRAISVLRHNLFCMALGCQCHVVQACKQK